MGFNSGFKGLTGWCLIIRSDFRLIYLYATFWKFLILLRPLRGLNVSDQWRLSDMSQRVKITNPSWSKGANISPVSQDILSLYATRGSLPCIPDRATVLLIHSTYCQPTPLSHFSYHPPIYAKAFQVVSSRQVSPPNPLIHFSCHSYVPYESYRYTWTQLQGHEIDWVIRVVINACCFNTGL